MITLNFDAVLEEACREELLPTGSPGGVMFFTGRSDRRVRVPALEPPRAIPAAPARRLEVRKAVYFSQLGVGSDPDADRPEELSVDLFAPLREATEELAGTRRARLLRVLEDWQRATGTGLWVPLHRGHKAYAAASRAGRYGTWTRPAPLSRSNLLLFLLHGAQAHPELARRRGGRRGWFEEWCDHAYRALRSGLAPEDLVGLLASTGSPRRQRLCLRRSWCPRRAAIALLERLRDTIFPHAPSADPLRPRLVLGDGLTGTT